MLSYRNENSLVLAHTEGSILIKPNPFGTSVSDKGSISKHWGKDDYSINGVKIPG